MSSIARYRVTLNAPYWAANKQVVIPTLHGSLVAAESAVIHAAARGWAALEDIEVIDTEEISDGRT